MRKEINGVEVDIGDIELYIEGFRGLKSKRYGINLDIKSGNDEIDSIVSDYKNLLEELPFPLNSIDKDIMYEAIGIQLVKDKGIECYTSNNSLKVKISEGRVIKFKLDSWTIEHSDNSADIVLIKDSGLDIYEGELGYAEYSWVVSEGFKKLARYYIKFMGGMVRACNRDVGLLRYELGRILDLGVIPSKEVIKSGSIIDSRTLDEYSMQVYISGERVDKEGLSYDYKIYKRVYDRRKGGYTSIKAVDSYEGFIGLYSIIVGMLRLVGKEPEYKGVIVGDKLVYEVGGEIYINGLRGYKGNKVLMEGIIYSYDRKSVYIKSGDRIYRVLVGLEDVELRRVEI